MVAGCVADDGGLAHRNGIRDGEGCLAFQNISTVEVSGLAAGWLWGRDAKEQKGCLSQMTSCCCV